MCHFLDGRKVQVYKDGDKNKIISELESTCTDNTWFILILSAQSVYFMLVTMTTVLYRNRHFLHYLIVRMRMRRERLELLLDKEREYKYDGFVSCTREGAKWCKKHFLPRLENKETRMKFCVAQRDFLIGKTIIDNIIDAINRSRKTILLVDETFIQSKWCQEELLLSHYVSMF